MSGGEKSTGASQQQSSMGQMTTAAGTAPSSQGQQAGVGVATSVTATAGANKSTTTPSGSGGSGGPTTTPHSQVAPTIGARGAQGGSSSTKGAAAAGGPRSWSGVAGGLKKGILDQNSPFFQEEFPSLATGGDEKSESQKKEDNDKEQQYGPGPSLRPQSK